MAKTQTEIDDHLQRTIKIANRLADEYGNWNGWTTGFGRNVALGEYIVEQTESGLYEPWMIDAKNAYLKWRKEHPEIKTTPPANLKAWQRQKAGGNSGNGWNDRRASGQDY